MLLSIKILATSFDSVVPSSLISVRTLAISLDSVVGSLLISINSLATSLDSVVVFSVLSSASGTCLISLVLVLLSIVEGSFSICRLFPSCILGGGSSTFFSAGFCFRFNFKPPRFLKLA